MNVNQFIERILNRTYDPQNTRVAFGAAVSPEFLIPAEDVGPELMKVDGEDVLILVSGIRARGFDTLVGEIRTEFLAETAKERDEPRTEYFIGYSGPRDEADNFLGLMGVELVEVEQELDDGFVALALLPGSMAELLKANGELEFRSGECTLNVDMPDHWPAGQ